MCEEMTEKEQGYEPIRLMEIDITCKKERWLEKYGWELSCQYVDSCWRWSKVIEGKLMACSMSGAIKIELDFLE